MKRNNLVNKKIISAIAIGLSAVMASTPITSLAAENEALDNNDNNSTTENQQEETATTQNES